MKEKKKNRLLEGGISWLASLLIILGILVLGGVSGGEVFAASSTITLTLSGSVVVNLGSITEEGDFGTSSKQTISITSDHYTGYTSSITGSDDNGRLIGKKDSSNYFSSITAATTESTFSASANTSYNNMWGFLPSKYNSADNSNYLPSPTTTATILDSTTAANSTANEYTLAIGARANIDTPIDSYSNTFVVTAVGNPSAYQATYNKNTTATVSNLPSTTTSTLSGSSFTVSSTTPTRTDGYTFAGWCVGTATTDSTTCSGTTISAGGTYTFSSVDQTSLNSVTLYALWNLTFEGAYNNAGKTNYNGYYKMQDMSSSICDAVSVTDESSQTQLIDTRDNKIYWVAKLQDGNCWMTQNLDLDLSTSTTLTSENTDLNTSGSGAYSTGYSTSGSVISWTPSASTLTSVSGWSDNYNNPYSFNPGTYYQNGTYFSSSTCNYLTTTCTNFSTTAYSTNGNHGAIGNYYSWTAAIASNSSSSLSSSTLSDPTSNPQNSICPSGWRLPTISSASNSTSGSTNEFSRLNYLYNSGSTSSDTGLFNSPLYFLRAGYVYSGALNSAGYYGSYWSSTVYGSSYSYNLGFNSSYIDPAYNYYGRSNGFSVRCVAR